MAVRVGTGGTAEMKAHDATYLPVRADEFLELALEHLLPHLAPGTNATIPRVPIDKITPWTYLSSSAMHRSFSRCVPCNRSSRFVYSFSNACTFSSAGR